MRVCKLFYTDTLIENIQFHEMGEASLAKKLAIVTKKLTIGSPDCKSNISESTQGNDTKTLAAHCEGSHPLLGAMRCNVSDKLCIQLGLLECKQGASVFGLLSTYIAMLNLP